ncbi:MAG: hydroxymethylglutaryl-CoA lyase [Burkholderiales bacterium]|jgi:hydroxymethylglutaryl-CoA lyase|nr:hydroxymethylglutaryl-CoA lyase [Burkholderiales bacterium]MCA3161028.1 hydroxymethylglutaryl-CoA lyase [Burkholderiales bacterium]MCA3162888.1 hydroxymethylglutaryl-CoA lyase [Burkholderiales bacterium]MCA3166163.1 hydroxymethylglutaryl-CoA lyase [Burkholderiales bacterium]MCA3169192.1 hydroxymethylglutaryl-CoA lyase [Burkholderiales bacterium]
MLPTRVSIVDVAPRDGLQNEKQPVSTQDKLGLIQRLQQAGVKKIEVTSYVSPKWVPQMADNAAVMQALSSAPVRRLEGVQYSVLVPNMQGLEAALAQPLPDEIVVFSAASEAFTQKNINCSIAESIARYAPVVALALERGIRVRGSISCSLGCPYQGKVPPVAVYEVASRMKNIGVQEIGVADTIGVGTPKQTQAAMEAALKVYALENVSGHFHDTYGQALVNIYACLQLGISSFDASVAGLGGCPYARGATGNVATEDVVYMLHGLGIETGIDLDLLVEAGAYISSVLGRKPASRAGNALLAKRMAD